MADERAGRTRTVPARILLADDHDLIRRGLRGVLEAEPDLDVVGEASNGREALELCRTLEPDLVLMDVRMPLLDGLAATRAIKRAHPGTAVLIVTMHDSPLYLLEALEAGAAGYVLKDAPGDRLINAVRRTLDGGSPLNQELAMELLQRLTRERTHEPAHKQPGPEVAKGTITPREVEVLQLLATGHTNQQIAQALVISKGTAKVHVERILRKLNASDRTQAVVLAIERGLLTHRPG